jgi:hypothetical protein
MDITDTGVRGYLRWLQRDQPGIYKAIAPKIATLVPQAFTDYEQSKAMGYLSADTTGGAVGDTTFFGDTVDAFTGVSSSAQPDVASVANVGTASPSISSILSNLVSGFSQAYLAKSQVDQLTQINNIQLQRAQAGLPPLNTSSLSLGIPQVNLGVSPGTLQAGGIGLIGVVVVVGILAVMFGGRHRGAAA